MDETNSDTEWQWNIVLEEIQQEKRRGDITGKEIRNSLHRFKRTLDKGLPDVTEGIAAADHGAERAAQGRQRRQRYID